MFKKIMIQTICAGIFFSGVMTASYAEEKKIKLGTGEWLPLTGKKLEHGGPINKIASDALTQLGYQPEFFYNAWAKSIENVAAGEYAVESCMWKTKEREENFIFTKQPILDGRVVFLKRKGDGWTFKGMNSLAGKKVGIMPGYGYGDSFLAAQNFTRDESPDLPSMIKKLVAGQIDVTLEDESILNYFITKEMPELAQKLELDSTPILRTPCYLTVSKKIPDAQVLADGIDSQLKKMKADKSYQQILKYYGLVK